jgi:hypothetical protein
VQQQPVAVACACHGDHVRLRVLHHGDVCDVRCVEHCMEGAHVVNRLLRESADLRT